jgi:signal transduction histidine kinase
MHLLDNPARLASKSTALVECPGDKAPREQDQHRQFAAGQTTRRWGGRIVLALAVGLAYFVVAQVTDIGLVLQPASISVFWPAAGVSSGAMIVLGSRGRWPAAAGIALGQIAIGLTAPQEFWHTPWVIAAVTLCDTAEPLIIAGLIARYFGPDFALDRVRNVLGFLAAAAIGVATSSLGAAVTLRLALGPPVTVLTAAEHWFASVFVGIITIAPLMIEVARAVRHPSPRSDFIEGTVALMALAAVTAVTILLPRGTWEILLPVAWSLPILLWLAARTRPMFAATGAFLVSITIVWTTAFGIGHFGDASLPVYDRVLGAQTAIFFVAISAYVLAALFAERRESEAWMRAQRAEASLQTVQAELARVSRVTTLGQLTASIAHEVAQPIGSARNNAHAALNFLDRQPPDLGEVREALACIVGDADRARDIIDRIRDHIKKAPPRKHRFDLNEAINEVIALPRSAITENGVSVQTRLAEGLFPVQGDRVQLQQVVLNLILNAVEAMSSVEAGPRELLISTEQTEANGVLVTVRDSGPGIDPEHVESVFEAFYTTKTSGVGMGLSICRSIIGDHGGRLWAGANEPGGSVFRFTLPNPGGAS